MESQSCHCCGALQCLGTLQHSYTSFRSRGHLGQTVLADDLQLLPTASGISLHISTYLCQQDPSRRGVRNIGTKDQHLRSKRWCFHRAYQVPGTVLWAGHVSTWLNLPTASRKLWHAYCHFTGETTSMWLNTPTESADLSPPLTRIVSRWNTG